MPVFISYSHQDKGFVDKFASHLMMHRAWVWVDTWEINVGDSIVQKVQDAIQSASALVVILSEASVESEWCKKELNAGLIRELDEKRVIILPVLLQDCEIPIFLKEKKYADFRTNFDDGLRDTLEAIAKVTSDTMGRMDAPDFFTDWAVDWASQDGDVAFRVTFVMHGKDIPYCVVTEALIIPNATAEARYRQYEAKGLAWVGRAVALEYVAEGVGKADDCFAILEDNLPVEQRVKAQDPKTNIGYDLRVTCRRLGEDTGKDVLVRWGAEFRRAVTSLSATTKKVSRGETRVMLEVIASPVEQIPSSVKAELPPQLARRKRKREKKRRKRKRG